MKVKWGGDDLESRLEEYEDDDYVPYDGPKPAKGMYSWNITEIRQGVSTNEFPQLRVYVTMDTRSRPDHRKYEGFRMSDRIIVKDDGSTDFRVMPFLKAIGVSVRDFLNNTDVGPVMGQDYNGNNEYPVRSIGKVRFDKGPVPVMGYIKPQKDNDDYYDIKFYPPKGNRAEPLPEEATEDQAEAEEQPAAEEPQAARRGNARGRRSAGTAAPF